MYVRTGTRKADAIMAACVVFDKGAAIVGEAYRLAIRM